MDTGKPTGEAAESAGPRDTTSSSAVSPVTDGVGGTDAANAPDGDPPVRRDGPTGTDDVEQDGDEPEPAPAPRAPGTSTGAVGPGPAGTGPAAPEPTDPEPAAPEPTDPEPAAPEPTDPEPADARPTGATPAAGPLPARPARDEGREDLPPDAGSPDDREAETAREGTDRTAGGTGAEDGAGGNHPAASRDTAAPAGATAGEPAADAGAGPPVVDGTTGEDRPAAPEQGPRGPAGTAARAAGEEPGQRSFSLFEKPPAPPTVPLPVLDGRTAAPPADPDPATPQESPGTAPEPPTASPSPRPAEPPAAAPPPGRGDAPAVPGSPQAPEPPAPPAPPTGSADDASPEPPQTTASRSGTAEREAPTIAIPLVPPAPASTAPGPSRGPSAGAPPATPAPPREGTLAEGKAVVPDRATAPRNSPPPATPVAPQAPGAPASTPAPSAPSPVPAPAPARSIAGVPVTRRTALWAGAAAAALALGGGGLLRWRSASGGGRPLRGAGWKEPFLTDRDQAQHWWGGSGVTFETAFTPTSGTGCLDLEEAALRRLDFVTCPDRTVADAMQERVRSVLGRPPVSRATLCTGSFVVLVHWEMLGALVSSGVLVRPSDVTTGARVDLNRYLQVCTDRWGEYDHGLTLDPDHAIALDGADPLTTSSGEALLAALDDARDSKDHPEDSGFPTTVSLWRPGTSATGEHPSGPLTRRTAADDSALVQELLDGDRRMVYVEEHVALRTVLGRGETDFVVLRTVPEVTFTHYLLVLTEQAELLGRRITEPEITKALGERWIRATGQEATISGKIHALGQNWQSALGDVEKVSWKDRTLSLDDLDVTSLVAQYRKGVS